MSVVLLSCLAATLISAAEPAPVEPADASRPAPFLRLRDATLEYNGPESAEPPPAGLTEIKIAWFGPQNSTNPFASDPWRAANLAIDEANAGGGCHGIPFRLVARWTADPWGSGAAQLARMIYTEEPIAVLGALDSPSTHLAEQIVAKAQLPLVSPLATDKSVTLAGVSWAFACAPTDTAIARILVADVLRSLKSGQRLVVLNTLDHESRMTVREVLKELARAERQPDFRYEAPASGVVDPRQMEALKQADPTAVLIIAGAEDSARLATAVRKSVPATVIFGSHVMGRNRFRQLAGCAAEKVRFPLLYVPDAGNPAVARFLQQFRSRSSDPPDYAAALFYDATRLLVEAICQAGPNRVRVRECLAKRSPSSGVTGTVQFDGTGQNVRTNLTMGTILNGTIVPFLRGDSPKTLVSSVQPDGCGSSGLQSQPLAQ